MDVKNPLHEEISKDIGFVTGKMKLLRSEKGSFGELNIKQMADFHRYAETRLFLIKSLRSLEGK